MIPVPILMTAEHDLEERTGVMDDGNKERF